MEARTWSSQVYRFGFNGKEKDDEVNVVGGTIAFEARIYDSRLCRFFSCDPLEAEYAYQSTYVFAHNSPIALIDYLGMGPNDPGKVKPGEGATQVLKRNGLSSSTKDGWLPLLDKLQEANPTTFTGYNPKWDNNKKWEYWNNQKLTAGQELNMPTKAPTITYVTRQGWNANPPNTNPNLSYTPISQEPNYRSPADYYSTIAIHHGGNWNNPTIKSIQEKHQNAKGEKKKADIGYHFAISQNGTIYQGRPINIKGSNVKNGNTGVIGIVLLGDYQNELLGNHSSFTPAMQTSLIRLVTFLDVKYKIENGVNGHNGLNCGHTVCPGDIVTDFLPVLLRQTGLKQAECINYENDD